MKPYAEVAISFASALVRGDFSTAHALLTDELRSALPVDALQARFHEMYDWYETPPVGIHSGEDFTMDDFAGRRPNDLGWAYISIHGDGWVEAVTVVVAAAPTDPRIREITWGRP